MSTLSTYLNSQPGNGGSIDADNSTTTPLDFEFTFTGEWTDVSAYSSLVVAVKTDQNGIIYIDFSPDGVNVDSTLTRYYRTDQIEPPHRFTITRKYARVRFANDSGSNQTYIRLQTLLGNQTDLNSPADSTLSQDFDAQQTRPTDFKIEVAAGLRQGRTTWNKWGYNDDVDTGSEEIVASWGGVATLPPTAQTVDFVSTSSSDASGGIGMNSIVIYGVDSNYEEVIEVLALNGLTTVTSVNTYIGINRVAPYLCGTSKYNVGTINGTQTTSAIQVAQIPATLCSTQQCIFYCQAGHTFMASYIDINVVKLSGGGGSPTSTIRGYVFSPVANANIQVFKIKVDTSIENTVQIMPTEPFAITEKSTLYFTAETDTNNTSVDIRFGGIDFRLAST